jgi:hypothetical protein
MWEPTNIWQVYATTLLKHCKIIATYLGWMTSGHTIMVTEMHRDQLQILGEFRSFFFFFTKFCPKLTLIPKFGKKSIYFHTWVANFCPTKWFLFSFVKESITTVLSTQLATCFKGHVQKCGQSRGNLSGMLCHYGCIKTFLKKWLIQKLPSSSPKSQSLLVLGWRGWAPDIISYCCTNA